MAATSLYNLNPLLVLATLCVWLGAVPLGWIWFRHRRAPMATRLRALTFFALFLTFDLVVFGAFTRLTDSGLGCPDWPGCYGNASPLGAHADIHAAQTAMPTGPVTHGKAWVEMVHRYLAAVVGLLITVLALASWWARYRKQATVSPWWATATFVWVCVQGAFGALTVTMKLYPAIVTAHLLGGLTLLALLAAQSQSHRPVLLRLPRALHASVWAVFALSALQIALGGWVSTNYAVLACTDFPTCQGQWWPSMDFAQGFSVLRGLGARQGGGFLPFDALTAIHVTHRVGALIVLIALAWLAWRLRASGEATLRPWARGVAAIAIWQFATGLSNVVLGWPLAAALGHTAGAAALITLLTLMLARAHPARAPS